MQCLIAVYSRQEGSCSVISEAFRRLNIPDTLQNFVILAQTVLEKFDPKPSEAALSIYVRDDSRPNVASNVISGEAVEMVGMDVRVEIGYSGSNRSWYIRVAHFVIDDERRRPTEIIT